MSKSTGRRPAYAYGVTHHRPIVVKGRHFNAANEPQAGEARQRDIEARFVDDLCEQEHSIEAPEAGLLSNLPHDA